MKKTMVFVFFVISLCIQAEESFSIDVGKSTDDISIYRVGIQHDISKWLKSKSIPLSGYVESSVNYWKSSGDEIYAVAVSPVFMLFTCKQCEYAFYLEVGVGLSFISQEVIDTRNMSSHFQFEDRIGFGLKVNNIDYHLRYMHYSNAGLAQPNDGIDILIAGMALKY